MKKTSIHIDFFSHLLIFSNDLLVQIKKRNIHIGFFFLLLMFSSDLLAQTLKKPRPIFRNFLCASDSYHKDLKVEFSWDPPFVASDNKFILELSDAQGSFANPVTLATVENKNTSNTFDFFFDAPNNLNGEQYKFRVRSTNPAKIGPETDRYGMYYVKSGSLRLQKFTCDGSATIIKVTNFTDETAYKWFHTPENGRRTQLTGETKNQISVNATGLYDAEIDYGTNCSSGTRSNIVQIDAQNGNTTNLTINGPEDLLICREERHTLEANIKNQDWEYTWYKDGEAITESLVAGYTYTIISSNLDFSGMYTVKANFGNCEKESNSVTVREKGVFYLTLDTPKSIFLSSKDTETISISTNAKKPKIKWYKDNVEIENATRESITVDEGGIYKVIVEQTEGCVSKKIIDNIEIQENFNIPNVITPNSDGINDLWVLPGKYANKENVRVFIYNSLGQEIFQANNYRNNWPGVAVSLSSKNIIFYYKIKKEDKILKQGTLTVIK